MFILRRKNPTAFEQGGMNFVYIYTVHIKSTVSKAKTFIHPLASPKCSSFYSFVASLRITHLIKLIF